MQEELNLFAQALSVTPSIKFKTPIAFLIPRTPSASIFGDSSLVACGGYSISQKFWWHLDFLQKIVLQTLLHIPSQVDVRFISINCLKYVTTIINFCMALPTTNLIRTTHIQSSCVSLTIWAQTNGQCILARSQQLVEPLQDSSADF